ncbi:MAG: DUF456 domain-containing protein [Bacteroidetes bacterium]|nr:MAG: DUF456 domain-containing protein [Bacteroidota bacterium]
MDTLLIIIGIILLILGIAGSFVPVLPGPPLSYLSLLMLQFTSYHPFSARFLVIFNGIIVGPFLGALVGEILAGKQSGEAFKAAFGSFLGFLAGSFMKLALSLIFVYYFIRALV